MTKLGWKQDINKWKIWKRISHCLEKKLWYSSSSTWHSWFSTSDFWSKIQVHKSKISSFCWEPLRYYLKVKAIMDFKNKGSNWGREMNIGGCTWKFVACFDLFVGNNGFIDYKIVQHSECNSNHNDPFRWFKTIKIWVFGRWKRNSSNDGED